MSTYLVTGATGGLGSKLLPQLVARGHSLICIARSNGEATAHERVQGVLGDMSKVLVVEGDVTQPGCGLSNKDGQMLREACPDGVIHCAADIRFSEKAKDSVYRTNYLGTCQMLDLANKTGIREVHHMSTAYVAGNTAQFTEENLYIRGMNWHNPYEFSKFSAERQVRAWKHDEFGRHYRVYRPSILIGCEDGSTSTFDAYYGWFIRFDMLAQTMRRRARKGEPLPPEVTVGPDGVVYLPLAVCSSSSVCLNLVPVDWCAGILARLIDIRADDSTCFLVHPSPPPVHQVITASLHALKIAGVRIVETLEEKYALKAVMSNSLRAAQKSVDAVLDQYLPYVTHSPHFEAESASRLLGEQYQPPSPIDAAYLGRLLAYAMRNNWGIPTKKGELEAAD